MAFRSDASNLVSGDTNGTEDIFVHDRQIGTTSRVSVDSLGAHANNYSYDLSISADAKFVAFASEATNLVNGDTNGASDVFLRDRQLGTTKRVSVDSGGAQGNGTSHRSSISADGRCVAFASWAFNLVDSDTNNVSDIFVHDQTSGVTERVSVSWIGLQSNSYSEYSWISADGRHVAFVSWASNLVPGDTNDAMDVFVRDRGAAIGTKYCVAVGNSTGLPADVSASGTASAGAANLKLKSSPVPNQPGIFVHGANQA